MINAPGAVEADTSSGIMQSFRLHKERIGKKVHLQQKTREGCAAQVKALATAHEGYDEPDIMSETHTCPRVMTVCR